MRGRIEKKRGVREGQVLYISGGGGGVNKWRNRKRRWM